MWNDLMSFVQHCHTRMLTFELKREDGQAMVEYGIIVGLVSVVAIGLLATIGTDIQGYFQAIVEAL